MTILLTGGAAVLLAVAVLGLGFVVGMRRRSRLVHAPMFWIQKHRVNPNQLRTAGQPGAYAAIIRHVGRRTGRTYETPVGVVAIGDRYLIGLPYGRRPSWLRNVLANGSATIVHEGSSHDVTDPAIVPMAEVEQHIPAFDRHMGRLLGTDECLRLSAR